MKILLLETWKIELASGYLLELNSFERQIY